ncbi:MAG: hypothetical protein GY946_19975 [bacterium]|nr:hypothetical protein [bacterium]
MERTIRRTRRALVWAGALLLMQACNRIEVAPEATASDAGSAGQTGSVSQTGSAAEAVRPQSPPKADLALRLSLDERFHVDRHEGAAMVLRLPDVPDVELWMAVGRDPVGGPVPGQQALVERALRYLEPVHGKVGVSTTAAGDSLLAFSGSVEDGNRTLHTWNWMVLRPGTSDVLRADVSLRVPGSWAERSDMKGLAGHVAERLASAGFEPDS